MTQRTVVCQAPLSIGFSRQEYWSGLPCTPLGDLPDPGIEPASLTSLAFAGGLFTTSTIWKAPLHVYMLIKCLGEQSGESLKFLTFERKYFKDHRKKLINEDMEDKTSLR